MAREKQVVKPQIKQFKLSGLVPAKYNPRVISDEALAGLTASIKKFGCVEPIIVNTRDGKNTIVGGNQRFRILCELYGNKYKCWCVTVDLNKNDEKLLNITLNNPHCQGEFIKELGCYIDKIRTELKGGEDFLDLRIDELREQVSENKNGCIFKQENLRPFQKTHVLLSFPPHLFAEIAKHLEAIIQIEGIEYEQGSN